MRTFIALTIVLVVSAVPVMAQSAADEAAVQEATKQIMETLNKGDVEGHVNGYMHPFEGFGGATDRATHVKNHQTTIARSKDNPRQQKMLEEIGNVFLTPEIAIHKYRLQWTGGIDEDGKAMPASKNLIARVYMKQNGKWLTKAIFTRPIEE